MEAWTSKPVCSPPAVPACDFAEGAVGFGCVAGVEADLVERHGDALTVVHVVVQRIDFAAVRVLVDARVGDAGDFLHE
jgi:hypothetical protein